MRKVWPAAAQGTARKKSMATRTHNNSKKKKLTAAKDKTTSAVKVPNGREYLGPHVNKETICNLFIFLFWGFSAVEWPPKIKERAATADLLFSRTLEEIAGGIKSDQVFRLKVVLGPAHLQRLTTCYNFKYSTRILRLQLNFMLSEST